MVVSWSVVSGRMICVGARFPRPTCGQKAMCCMRRRVRGPSLPAEGSCEQGFEAAEVVMVVLLAATDDFVGFVSAVGADDFDDGMAGAGHFLIGQEVVAQALDETGWRLGYVTDAAVDGVVLQHGDDLV